jgi:hypothetical protein
VGAAVGSLLARGTTGVGVPIAIGVVAGFFLTSAVLRLLDGYRRLIEQQRNLRGLSADTDPGVRMRPGSSSRGGSPTVMDAIIAMDPTLEDLVPDQLREVQELLQPGESLANLAAGTTEGHPGLLVITDHRIAFMPKKQAASVPVEIPLSALVRVAVVPSDLLGSLTVVYEGGTRAFEVPGRALQEIGDFLRARVPSA